MKIKAQPPFYADNPPALRTNGAFYPEQLSGRLIDPPNPMRRGGNVTGTNLRYFGMNGAVSACGLIVEWRKDRKPIVVLVVPVDRLVGTSAINMAQELFVNIAAHILPDADPNMVIWHTASDRRNVTDTGIPARLQIFRHSLTWQRSLRTWNPVKLMKGRRWDWSAESENHDNREAEQGELQVVTALVEEYWPTIEPLYPDNMSSDREVLFRQVYGTPTPPA